MNEPLLRVEDLSLSFPALRGERTLVLDRVSFGVGRQETVALVGESGSGGSCWRAAICSRSTKRRSGGTAAGRSR